jgi:hypothetical protein
MEVVRASLVEKAENEVIVIPIEKDTALPAAMRYILKAESYDRIGIRKKNYIT